MALSRYDLTLDLQATVSQVQLNAVQGDRSRALYISFSDGGKPVKLDKVKSAAIYIERPDKTAAEDDVIDVEGEGAYVIYNFTEQTCAMDGVHYCQVTLYDENESPLYSPEFTMYVSKKKTRRT